MRRPKFSFFASALSLLIVSSSGIAYSENDAQRLSEDAARNNTGYSAARLSFISEDELSQKVKLRDDKKISFQLVDLRLEGDFANGHIPGAVNIPSGKKLSSMAEKMLEKSDIIILYGYSRNDKAAENALIFLLNKRFERVSIVEGGIEEWRGKIE